MDDFEKISLRGKSILFFFFVVANVVFVASWLFTSHFIPLQQQAVVLIISEVILVAASWVVASFVSRWLLTPLKFIWQTVLYLSPSNQEPVPKPSDVQLGRELAVNLSRQIYQLVSDGSSLAEQPAGDRLDFVCNNLPVPIVVIDSKNKVKYTNTQTAKLFDKQAIEMIDQNAYDLLDMSFRDNDTFDSWLQKVRHTTASAYNSWNRVKLSIRDKESPIFDVAAFYNRDNTHNFETIIVLFDQTKKYTEDEDQSSYVALAVHELRNPLTMLRGYIEVLEEEVDDKTNLELTTDLHKMRASAKLLTEYTNNILNVSRVDSNQLSLKLKSEDWREIITSVVESMRLRAQVRALKIDLKVADNLPKVGVDRVSVSEVLTNLIDNAIKYSHANKSITITSKLNNTGEVETTVHDFGVVIGQDVIGNLFQRYYRNHRSRSQASGAGLGLYLSKSLITAQGGNIWVSSNEHKGTTFGFTVLPYDKINKDKDGNNEVTRTPHGWIKNHSLYRR